MLERYGPAVADLIPNLNDLLAALPSTPAGRDAAELAAAAGGASTPAEVDDVLDQVISRWVTA